MHNNAIHIVMNSANKTLSNRVAGLPSCLVAELPGSRVADVCMLSVTFTVLCVYTRNVFAVLKLAFH